MSYESVNYIVLAIPVFLLLIGIELAAVWFTHRNYYRLNDAVNDLSCGILDQLLEAFMKTVLFTGYVFAFERLRLGTLPGDRAWVWVACFLGVDFLYYWFHRLSHEVNAFWAAHVVHHQSEEYNLAVALRQGALQSWFSWIFYLPLAALGFPPLVFLACSSFNTLYQFWIHTRVIGRLGTLEWVLNTPSNHRVHHGRNPKYIDRNHGGTLIVWDRLFGTYQAEEDEVVYGITTPLASWNPLWANLSYWFELASLAKRTRSIRDRLRLFVKPPGWRPEELGGFQPAPEVDRASYRKWDVSVPRRVQLYAGAQFALVLFAAGLLLNVQDRLPPPLLAGGALLIVAALVAIGALFEGRRWAPWFEAARLVATVAVATAYLMSGAFAGPAWAAAPAKSRPSKLYTIEQFMAMTSVRGASFSADEKRILYSSNETGIFNVYSVPTGGGPATAVTSSTTESTYAVGYFPTDDRILYTRDQGGNELDHLYVLGIDGKEADLTPGAKLKARFRGFTPRGEAFYVQTNERDPRFFDLYRYDSRSYERKLLYKDETGYELGAISSDGRYLAFEKPRTTVDSDLYLWDATRNQMQHLTPHEGEASHSPAEFDPETRFLYYRTDFGGEFARLKRYDLASGRHEEVERADWDISSASFSLKGRYRVTGINQDGRTVIRIVDVRSGAPVAIPALPAGDVTSVVVSRSERRIAFYASADRSPPNLYVYAFGDEAPTRLTDTLSKDLDGEDLVESDVVRFKSFDGTVIPNILWKPHQATPAAKAPALVWVHGGPGGQTRKGYSALIQYLVNHGYVVLGINNRGSSGYGKAFYAADDQRHGREPLWDCIEGKKYLASLPYVDAQRIGIIGGSYGGYMVLAALAFKPEAFAAGVDIFGVSNWLRTLDSMPKWWEAQRKALYKEMGDPETQKEMLREISPLFHADRIARPLIVLQGANDPRVVKPESDDIVASVKANGVPVEYVVFDDEGHGFTKKKNQIEGYGAILRFLDAHLRPSATKP